MDTIKRKVSSRKFIMAAAAFLFVVLTDTLGVNVNPDTYWAVIGVATSYIAGEAAVDIVKK